MQHAELLVSVREAELVEEAETFLSYVSNYVMTSRNTIHSSETMSYGYWLVKFAKRDTFDLETWEYNAHATAFVPGANLTLSYWRDQHIVCPLRQAEFKPPRPDKLTFISKGVFEGLLVQGVRYPSPEHVRLVDYHRSI